MLVQVTPGYGEAFNNIFFQIKFSRQIKSDLNDRLCTKGGSSFSYEK